MIKIQAISLSLSLNALLFDQVVSSPSTNKIQGRSTASLSDITEFDNLITYCLYVKKRDEAILFVIEQNLFPFHFYSCLYHFSTYLLPAPLVKAARLLPAFDSKLLSTRKTTFWQRQLLFTAIGALPSRLVPEVSTLCLRTCRLLLGRRRGPGAVETFLWGNGGIAKINIGDCEGDVSTLSGTTQGSKGTY
jgi:hypothetical protein